jgi:alcohol dehydrogenase
MPSRQNLSLKALPLVLEDGSNTTARGEIQWASTLAGLAISQTRTAIAHSISYPLTLKFGVPHGLACGFTLESLIDVYIKGGDAQKNLINILNDLKALLGQFMLKEKINGYASTVQVKQLVGDMYNPSRADNYIYKADEEFILDVLTNSL